VTRTESKSRTAPYRRYRASVPTALDPDAIADALIENLHCPQAKRPEIRDAQRLVHGARLHGPRTGVQPRPVVVLAMALAAGTTQD